MSEHEQYDIEQPQDEVRVPPTVRGEIPKPAPIWPTVVGVISIVWAGLGLISVPFVILMVALMPEEFASSAVYLLTVLVGLALSILVLVAGIRILQRRQSGAYLARLWSIISIVWVPIGLALTIATELSPGVADPFELAGMFIGGACGGVFALLLPIFLLIWFSSSSIKAAVTGWKP